MFRLSRTRETLLFPMLSGALLGGVHGINVGETQGGNDQEESVQVLVRLTL